MLGLVLFGLLAVHHASGVINRLTSVEYEQLPPLTAVDSYSSCMHRPGDIYCFVSTQLYGNLSDPLFKLMVEYSANNITHYDHTHMHRGICPRKTCQKFMNSSNNLTEVIEACLNDTLTREYRLTAKVFDIVCQEYEQSLQLDAYDYAYGAIVMSLLGLALLGSLYDFYGRNGQDTFGRRCLKCFSVRESWRRLVAPGSSGPMQRRIKMLFGFRTITSILVIMAHAPLPSLLMSINPQYFEETYHYIIYHMMYNGTLIVQTFFIMSAFLTAYNILLSEQKRQTCWHHLPKAVLMRWLRLTPPYAFVMFYVMTWARHLGSGPMHLIAVQGETNACWQDWWLHLLYIHNYKDRSQCMAHAWYLAADFQLSVLGLAIFCLVNSNRARKVVIGAVVVLGLVTPAVHTFVQNLHAVLIVSPEVALNFFVNDPTFNNLYKRGHTNLVCYGLGLGLAYVIFNLKDSDIGSDKLKKYRVLYWLLFPIMVAMAFMGAVFYVDNIVIPIAVRVVYSSVIKIVFGFVNILFIYFTIMKIDRVVRGTLNWAGWTRISRLTYLAYLLHVPLLRFAAGNTESMPYMGKFWHAQNYMSTLCLSYLMAVPLYILVECPLAEFLKLALAPAPRPEKTKHVTMDSDVMSSKDTIEIKL